MLELAVPFACEVESELPESVIYCSLPALSDGRRRATDWCRIIPHATDIQENVSKNSYVR
jgi:hypothetical protein